MQRAADTRPKWLSGLYGRQHCVQEYIHPTLGSLDNGELPCVLTEDILSAAKIGLSGAPVAAIPCLGTLPSPAVLARAAESPLVIWWLDPDAAGQRMALKGNSRLAAIGLDSRIMLTHPSDQDPKYLDAATIRRRVSSLTRH
jgi:DNA primase